MSCSTNKELGSELHLPYVDPFEEASQYLPSSLFQ